MLRRNILLGWMLSAFGAGFLFGMWIEGNFLTHCIGFGLVIAGVSGMCKKV